MAVISMAQWKDKSTYKVGSSDHYISIKGQNGWELEHSWSTGDKVNYSLANDKMKMPHAQESEYQESANYFYAQVSRNPVVYVYVSKSEGGAIPFRGKGRWSGSADNFGQDLKIQMGDASFGRMAGYAMPVEQIESIIRKNFPGLRFKSSTYGTIQIDWSRVITDKNEILRTLVQNEIRKVLKSRGIQLNEYVMAVADVEGREADIQIGTTTDGTIGIGIRTKGESTPLKYVNLTKEEVQKIIGILQRLL